MNSEIRNREIRILIIEDEVHNSRMLQGLMDELRPRWKVEAVLESIEDSVNWLNANVMPDLILLDIQLSDGISFSIFERVRIAPGCRIIFTTAYDEFAIRAFKVNSIDYLLKPIAKDELEAALDKYEQVVMASDMGGNSLGISPDQFAPLFESILERRKEYRTRFLVPGVSSWEKVDTRDIAYIYSENKLTFAVDRKGREYVLDYSLEKLESELDPNAFFRANRKVIVHADSVIRILNEKDGKLALRLDPSPSFDITVSRLKAGDFKQWMGK